jgi:enamidase
VRKLRRVLLYFLGFIVLGTIAYVIALNLNQYDGAEPARGVRAIQNVVLWKGRSEPPIQRATIVIEEDRIACAGRDCDIPKDARVLDGRGLAALPGFIDLHVHLLAPVGADATNPFFPLRIAIWDGPRHRPAVRRAMLEHGVTAFRSAGTLLISELDLSARVTSGELAGPRVFTAGPHFTAPGGHPAGTFYRFSKILQDQGTRQVEDPIDGREEVRRLAEQGIDGIKIVYQRFGEPGAPGYMPRISLPVMESIIREAHQRGLWVAVHTGSVEEWKAAVEAGADTIEHGSTSASHREKVDPDLLSLMKDRGVTFVPTLAVLESTLKGNPMGMGADDAAAGRGDNALSGARAPEEVMRVFLSRVGAASRAGVAIGLGTDSLGAGMAFGDGVHREFELLVEAGLTPTQALLAGTRNAANALGVIDELGTIEKGKLADVVLVAGRPWENISDVRRVRMVIQRGNVLVDTPE